MNFIPRLIIYLVINFAALAAGSFLMGDAVTGDWYQNLNKAPWTPPGWVFGVAWTVVMVAFSYFMANATNKTIGMENISALKVLFWIQWLLNVVWNYVFFNQQLVLWGLIEIIGLFIVVCSIFYIGLRWMGFRAFWLLPYIFWLMIAISLNAFIVFRN